MNIEEVVSVPIGEVAVIRRLGPDDAHGEVLVKEERGSPCVGRLTRHHLRCLKVTATKRMVGPPSISTLGSQSGATRAPS